MSPAQGAVTIGETFVPTTGCPAGATAFGAPSPPAPAVQFNAPSAGVITSWSFQGAAAVPATVRFKVGRPVGGGSYTITGQGSLEVPTANVLNTFPTRVPIAAGDVIGYFASAPINTCARALAGYGLPIAGGDVPIDTAPAYGPNPGFELNLSAQLEPDADNDGFGDETQDACPTDATRRGDCTPPETTITKQPKKKDKKKKSSFEFTSSEAGSSFRCSVNGSAFEVCTSPRAVKAKKGLNTFTVFARDAAGNIDESPATYSWTYKKKKPKKK